MIAAEFALVLLMFAVYLIGKRLLPRYAIILVLVAGTLFAWSQGLLQFEAVHVAFAKPEFVMPEFALTSLLGVG